MAWRLAIDFGTSNTAAAIEVQGVVRPIALSDGGITMPSAVVLTPTGFRVGEEAINAQLRHPDGFERTPKALIGRGEVVLAGQIVSPESLITEVYSYVREAALRRQNGEQPSEVWLTHPVAWAPSQVEALRTGAIKAGFVPETIRTVPEPIAAAAHYARNHSAAPGSRVAVFDFGGGTLDIAVLERAPQLPVGYKVLAYGGDPVLGGRTFDARLLDWTLETLARRGHEELAERLHRPKTMAELRAQTSLSRAVTAAKTELSTRPDADVSVSLGDDDAVVTITRAEYEKLIADDMARAAKLLTDVFERVSGPAPEVLYLTGGSSRTPAISQRIKERTQITIATLDDPKLVVPEGALFVGNTSARGANPGRATGSAPARPAQPPVRPAGGPAAPGAPSGAANQQRPASPVGPAGPASPVGPAGPNRPGGPSGTNGPTGPGGNWNNTGVVPRPTTGAPVGPAPAPTGANRTQFPSGPAPSFPGNAARPAGAPQPTPSNSQQPFGIAGPGGPANSAAMANRERPKKKKLGTGALIGIIVAALVVVGGGIWGATALLGGGGGNTEETTAVETIDVPTGNIDCWDGSTAASGANCPALDSEAALNWVVKVDGASCTPTEIEGATANECTWYDRPNTHLFIMKFDSHESAVSYGETAYGSNGSDWNLGEERTGLTWEGPFDQSPGGYSHYYVYDGQPYAIFARMDNGASGGHDTLSQFSNRFKPKSLADLRYALATTERV